MSEILPRLYLELLHSEGCGQTRLSVRKCKKFGFVLKSCLVGYFLCSNSIFPFLVPPSVYFFCHYPPHRAVSIRMLEQQMKLQLLGTATTPPLRPLCIPGTLKTRTCEGRSYILVHQGLPRYAVELPRPARLCRPCFFKTYVADCQVGIGE